MTDRYLNSHLGIMVCGRWQSITKVVWLDEAEVEEKNGIFLMFQRIFVC